MIGLVVPWTTKFVVRVGVVKGHVEFIRVLVLEVVNKVAEELQFVGESPSH